MSLPVVSTSVRSTPELIERATTIANRVGARYVPRRGSFAKLLADHKAPFAYVVSREREEVRSENERLAVFEGLLHSKVASGANHPLVRALGEVRTVIDGTLGLAGDALHIAAATGARVHGTEASPWVHALVESGLQKLVNQSKWSEAAGRIEVHASDSATFMASGVEADAVFLAPMFVVPAKAAPGFGLFRRLADHRPLDGETFEHALRAAPRVVVRVEKGDPAPFSGMESLKGRAVDYWIARR